MAKPAQPAMRNCRPKPQPLRARGRSLTDFGELSPAEMTLLRRCRRGTLATIDTGLLPQAKTDSNCVRAKFVRFLALGGDDRAPVHEHGVHLAGAWLTGRLDLKAAKVEVPLVLRACAIESMEASQGSFKGLDLNGSRLGRGLVGGGLRCAGDISLRGDFHAIGEVHLVGAAIEGSLYCGGHPLDPAYGADPARPAVAPLESLGGRFENPGGPALSCHYAVISGSVFLSHGFCATGEVGLIGTRIGADLDCTAGSFDVGKEEASAPPTVDGLCALSCERAKVGGGLFFRQVAKAVGCVNLSLMRVDSLSDDEASWAGAQTWVVLDGFSYGRLGAKARTEWTKRVAWLDRQLPDHLGKDFRPQPWEQLIKVLREIGHPNEARAIAIEKQERLRRTGRLLPGMRPLHWLYGALVGYGYRPMRLLGAAAAVWLLCAIVYWSATNLSPCGPGTYLLAPPERNDGTRPPADRANFVPLIYSADVLLPVVDLGYKQEWKPVVSKDGKPLRPGQLLRFLYWFEIAFGWVAGLLLVGVLGNLIKKD